MASYSSFLIQSPYPKIQWSGLALLTLSLFSSSTFPLSNLCIQVMSMSMLLTLDFSLTQTYLNAHGFSCLLDFSLTIFSSWKVIHLPPALGKFLSYFKTLLCDPDSTYIQAELAISDFVTTPGICLISLITQYYNCYFSYVSCTLDNKFQMIRTMAFISVSLVPIQPGAVQNKFV